MFCNANPYNGEAKAGDASYKDVQTLKEDDNTATSKLELWLLWSVL